MLFCSLPVNWLPQWEAEAKCSSEKDESKRRQCLDNEFVSCERECQLNKPDCMTKCLMAGNGNEPQFSFGLIWRLLKKGFSWGLKLSWCVMAFWALDMWWRDFCDNGKYLFDFP